MNLSKQAVSKQNVTCCQTRALLPPPSSQATVINWSPAGSLTQVSLSLLQTVCFITVVKARRPAPSFADCEHRSLLSVTEPILSEQKSLRRGEGPGCSSRSSSITERNPSRDSSRNLKQKTLEERFLLAVLRLLIS